jgi:predicted dehydrogenase
MIKILGDIMLDRWIAGTADRMSPEAPIPILLEQNQKVSPGGAGEPIVFHQDSPVLDPTVYALRDFAECILTGKKPTSNVRTGKDVAIAVHMGNKAAETETTQYWKSEYDI